MSVEARFLQSTIDCSTRDCARYQIAFHTEAYEDDLFDHLGVCYPGRLDRAVVKRRAEFLAGRYAAKRCFSNIGELPLSADFRLESGDHGEPLWPAHLVGSITHTHDLACAVVAHSNRYEGVGVDIEHWIAAERFLSVKEQILSPEEERWLVTQDRPIHQLGTIVFSAKESLFKALYPSVGSYFDFHAAQVIQLNQDESVLQLRLLRTLSPSAVARQGCVYTVDYTAASDTVYTQLLVKRCE